MFSVVQYYETDTSLITIQFELFFCIEFPQTLFFFEGRGVRHYETIIYLEPLK